LRVDVGGRGEAKPTSDLPHAGALTETELSLRHWLQLALTDGIGPILARRLTERAGDIAGACNASVALLRSVEGIGTAKAGGIHESLRGAASAAASELERARRMGISIICPDDEAYPVLLRTTPDPPLVLYVKGTLEPRDLNALAIVGSRKCSFYGREQAERFAALLAGAGFTIISGGARGIDSAAHRGAMSHPQGRTIAVLGSGVDVPYPPENDSLFEQIARRGAVVSEFPLGTPPNRENFPRRNRVVSGMSRGVIVVEADEKSGALITARVACDDHDRPVFALPGRVDNPLSAGPHLLIRDGAALVTKLEDVLEALGPVPQPAMEAGLFPEPEPGSDQRGISAPSDFRSQVVGQPGLSERQRLILAGLGTDGANVDAIVERTGLPAHVVLQELTFLSLKGQVRRVDGQTYSPRKGAPT
jgi:DNA processing protein